MTVSGIDGGVKMRPSPAELEAFGPEFKKRWDEEFVDKPDKPVLWMGVVSMYVHQSGLATSSAQLMNFCRRLVGDPSSVAPRKYFSLGYYNVSCIPHLHTIVPVLTSSKEYPAARGHIHITDGEDVQAPTDFRTGFLDE